MIAQNIYDVNATYKELSLECLIKFPSENASNFKDTLGWLLGTFWLINVSVNELRTQLPAWYLAKEKLAAQADQKSHRISSTISICLSRELWNIWLLKNNRSRDMNLHFRAARKIFLLIVAFPILIYGSMIFGAFNSQQRPDSGPIEALDVRHC